MVTSERLIDVCEKLPGYYGYRPSMENQMIWIDELMFHLEDKTNDYTYMLHIFLEKNKTTHAYVDVRYDDGSISRVREDDPEFEDIIHHKNKLMSAFIQMQS